MREQYAGSHKYGGDAFAAWLDTLEPDETFGDVLDAIWDAWYRRGTAMRDVDPDCYSVTRGDER